MKKQTHKITGTIQALARLNNSPMGNPKFAVKINGATYKTKANISDAYKLCQQYVGKRVTVDLEQGRGALEIVSIDG